jgi:hypothetical protein
MLETLQKTTEGENVLTCVPLILTQLPRISWLQNWTTGYRSRPKTDTAAIENIRKGAKTTEGTLLPASLRLSLNYTKFLAAISDYNCIFRLTCQGCPGDARQAKQPKKCAPACES